MSYKFNLILQFNTDGLQKYTQMKISISQTHTPFGSESTSISQSKKT